MPVLKINDLLMADKHLRAARAELKLAGAYLGLAGEGEAQLRTQYALDGLCDGRVFPSETKERMEKAREAAGTNVTTRKAKGA